MDRPLPLPPETAAYYGYPARQKPDDFTIRLAKEARRFRQFVVQFPLSYEGFKPTEPIIEFEWYASRAPGRRPAILFNPILGGDYPLERGVCRYFASRGFHVALVHRRTLKISPEQSTDDLEVLLRQGVIRTRQVVDWMARREEVDPARLGSFGISMGGIVTVMTAAVEPRLRAHVAALSGGGIADILATTHDSLLTKPMKKYLKARGLSEKELIARLREQIRTDPIRLAPYVNTSRLLMFIALADRTIGRENSFRLWHALDEPPVILIPLGHYTSYLYLPYMKRASLRFFQRHL